MFGEEGSVLVVYDLADPDQWAAAGEARRAWGRRLSTVHAITNDVVVIEFKSGGASGASA